MITDGRMSGASGKVPAAIHLTPEAIEGGPIAKIRTGDIIRIDCEKGILELYDYQEVSKRSVSKIERKNTTSLGRGLFEMARKTVSTSEKGASFIQLCNKRNIPLIFLHNVTGFLVGKDFERQGIIKKGSQLILSLIHI